MPSPIERVRSFIKGRFDAVNAPEIVQRGGNSLYIHDGVPVTGTVIDFSTAYHAIKKHADTAACFRYLTNTTGKAGYDFASTIPDKDKPDERMVKRAERVLLGIKGNQSFRKKVKATVLHTNGVGNYFWVIERNADGDPIGTVQLHPKTTTIVVDVYGQVRAYAQILPGRDPKVFQPRDVVHFTYGIDPEDDVYGVGPLMAVLGEIDADLMAAKMNQKILQNDMKVPFILMLDKELSDADYTRVSTYMREEYTGYAKAGKPMLASGVTDVKTIGQSFRDMQFLDLRKLSTEKVCAALGVPKSLIGYRDSANEATAGKVDRQTVYEDTIRPLEEMIAEKINTDLFPKCGIEGIKFEFNYSSGTEASQVEQSTREDVKLGIRTINEARYERGLEPFDDTEYPLAGKPINWSWNPVMLDSASPAPPTPAPERAPADEGQKSLPGALNVIESYLT